MGVKFGGDGNETFVGETNEANTLFGGGGNDSLVGSSSVSDVLFGGNGDDTVRAGFGGTDAVFGDNGNDVLILNGFVTAWTITMFGGFGTAQNGSAHVDFFGIESFLFST